MIVLTTRGDESSRAAALGAGASLYLTKPFVPHALAGQARSCWRRRHPLRLRTTPMSSADDNFLAGFMDDYFAECDEHLGAIRRLLLALEALDRSACRSRRPGGALSQLSFDQRHFGDGRAARGGDARASHGELSSRAPATARAVSHRRASTRLIRGVGALERTIAARRASEPVPSTDEAVAHRRGDVGCGPRESAADGRQSRSPPSWRCSSCRRRSCSPVASMSIRCARDCARLARSSTRSRSPAGRHRFRISPRRRYRRRRVVALARRRHRRAHRGRRCRPRCTRRRVDRRVQPAAPLTSSHVVRVELDATRRIDADDRRPGDQPRAPRRCAGARRAALAASEWRAIQENAPLIERQLRDLREGVTRVRLVPVREIFRRMPFVVAICRARVGASGSSCAGSRPRSTST